ncbi:hypothetical protein [Cellulomonas sp. URHB0016]
MRDDRVTAPLPAPARGRAAPGAVPGDLVRAVALGSVVVATWRYGLVAAALFLLVLGGTMLPRAAGVGSWVDTAYCATLVLAAWAAQLDWYVAVPWLDVPVHAAATALVAVVVLDALTRTGVLDTPDTARLRWGSAVVVVGLGAVASVLWELGEWAGHTFLDSRIQVGYEDTVGDLAAGLVGSVVAALLVRRAPRSGGRQ